MTEIFYFCYRVLRLPLSKCFGSADDVLLLLLFCAFVWTLATSNICSNSCNLKDS